MNDTTFQGDGKVAYVPVVVNAKLTKQTNADKLRSMTDEELAGWLKTIVQSKSIPIAFVDGELIENWLDWLKEVSE